MLKGLRRHLSYANVMATIAVFVALGGAGYAAVKLPKNSVGTKQLKRDAVTSVKIRNSTVTGGDVKNGSLSARDFGGSLPAGPPGPKGNAGPSGTIAGAPAGGALTGSYPNPQIAAGAVTAGGIAAAAVTSGGLAAGAVTSGGLATGAAAPRLFAHVSSSGVIGESQGVTGGGRVSKGNYYVAFNRALNGCVAVASVGFGFGPGVIGAGATAQPRMNYANDSSQVGVTVYRGGYTFTDVEDDDVSVIVMC